MNLRNLTLLLAGMLFGFVEGFVCALALGHALRPSGVWEDEAFKDYASLVAGEGRVLAVAKTGALFLFEATAGKADKPTQVKAFQSRPDDAATEVWSYPVVLNGCLFLRSQDEVVCLALQGGR